MNEFSRYPSDIENFATVNFKVEPVSDKTKPVKKKKKPKIDVNPELEEAIKNMKDLIARRQAGVRPNIATLPYKFGPGPYNDGPNS